MLERGGVYHEELKYTIECYFNKSIFLSCYIRSHFHDMCKVWNLYVNVDLENVLNLSRYWGHSSNEKVQVLQQMNRENILDKNIKKTCVEE